MVNENMTNWRKMCKPPADALKKIPAGRLKGKSDINPQWRYEVMTEVYGPCGVGWKLEINKLWREQGSHDQVMCFADVSVYTKEKEVWSGAIPGIGGSMLVTKESAGLHTMDEGYKMAVTDGLGTAMKLLGVAADVYRGQMDTKYSKPAAATEDVKAKTYKNFDFLKKMGEIKKELATLTGNDYLYKKTLGGKGYEHSNEIEPPKQKAALKYFEKILKDTKEARK